MTTTLTHIAAVVAGLAILATAFTVMPRRRRSGSASTMNIGLDHAGKDKVI